MAIRTLKFALRDDPANSRAIGYHAAQQNAAYHHAVDAVPKPVECPHQEGDGNGGGEPGHTQDNGNLHRSIWPVG